MYTSTGTFVVFYDGSQGTIYDGYWASDGNFYFRTAPDQPFQQGTSDHFRRTKADGFSAVRGTLKSAPTQPAPQPQQ
jgi:hypothetical protein